MGLLVLVLSRFLTANILTIAFLIILASIFYFGLIYIMVGKQLIVDIKKLFMPLGIADFGRVTASLPFATSWLIFFLMALVLFAFCF